MKRAIFTFVSVTVVAAELILAFYGPMGRLARTPLILAPIQNSSNADEELLEEISLIIESHMVKTGSFSIVKRSRWDDYFHKNQDRSKESSTLSDYFEIAKEIEVNKILLGYLYGSEKHGLNLYISLKDVSADLVMESLSYKFTTPEELDSSDAIIDEFSSLSKRFSLYDYFFMLLLAAQFILTIKYALKKPMPWLIETVMVMTTVLFLFSFYFARNANMDYFQRFVATKGQVTIAQDSRTELLYALIRYGPLLILNMLLYIKSVLMRGDRKLVLVILSSILYSLSFPNELQIEGFPFIVFFALIPLFSVLVQSSYWKGVYYGSVFGVFQAIFINFWQATYSYIGLSLVTLGLFIQYSLFMIVLNLFLLGRRRSALYFIPPLWMLFEYIRSIGYIAFPWGLAGTTLFSYTPLIQLAAFTGIWGVSLLVLYVNAALTDLVLKGIAFRKGVQFHTRKTLFPPALVLIVFVLVFIGGVIRMFTIARKEALADKVLNIVVIQQNRDPRKHNFKESLGFAMEMTRKGIREAGKAPDLIVWPEGAFKADIRMFQQEDKRKSSKGKLLTEFENFAIEVGSPIVTGTQDHIYLKEWDEENQEEKEIRRNFNSSALLDKEGRLKGIYHKIHLVPFTEHFPYKKQLPRVWEFLQKYDTSNWLAGTERTVLDTGSVRFCTPICFEDVFPDHIRRFILEGCDLIANISNDYWSLSPVEGMQHGINGLFRAVENGRPMVRSTTSGYTVYADSTGRIRTDLDEFYTKGVIVAEIPVLDRPLTLYTRWGDWLPKLVLFIILCESLRFWIAKILKKHNKRFLN